MVRTHYKAALWYSGYDGCFKKGGVKRLLKRVDSEINSLDEASDYNIFNLCELFELVTIEYIPVHCTPLLTVVGHRMDVSIKIGDFAVRESWGLKSVVVSENVIKKTE